MMGAKNPNATLSPASICDADVAGSTHSKLYKSEDIPLTISASLAKQSSLMRTRARKNTHDTIVNDDYSSIRNGEHHQDSNESNDDDIDYTYSNPHSNPHIHYSTMSSNTGDYLRKTTGHLHRNVNNNSTIGSTNRYRWHNQSDEIALQSLRNNSMTIAAPSKAKANAITTHSSNHRGSHTSGRKQQQQQHHLNQINNNFIVTNKKHSAMVQNTHNDQNSIDQNNGNHYPSRLYH